MGICEYNRKFLVDAIDYQEESCIPFCIFGGVFAEVRQPPGQSTFRNNTLCLRDPTVWWYKSKAIWTACQQSKTNNFFLKKYTFNRTKCRRNRKTRKPKRALRKLVQAGMERRENRREKKATPSTSIRFSNKFILIRASRVKRWELWTRSLTTSSKELLERLRAWLSTTKGPRFPHEKSKRLSAFFCLGSWPNTLWVKERKLWRSIPAANECARLILGYKSDC